MIDHFIEIPIFDLAKISEDFEKYIISPVLINTQHIVYIVSLRDLVSGEITNEEAELPLEEFTVIRLSIDETTYCTHMSYEHFKQNYLS